MELEIHIIKPFKNKKGDEFKNYKVSLNNYVYWISDLDFLTCKELIPINVDRITLKDPFEEYYQIVERQNKNGKFHCIVPMNKYAGVKEDENEGSNVSDSEITAYKKEILTEPKVVGSNISANIIAEIMEEHTSSNSILKGLDPDRRIPPLSQEEMATEMNLGNEDAISFGEIASQHSALPLQGEQLKSTKKAKPKMVTSKVGKSEEKSDFTSSVDFVATLLNDKRLKPVHKEKLFKLTAEEIKKFKGVDDDILKRIEKLEKKINPKDVVVNSHNPSVLVDYLYKFSSDESLKWLTHEKENDFDYSLILEESKKTFRGFKKTQIPSHTYFNIKNFIHGNAIRMFPSLDIFGNKRIFLDWSAEEVLEWCKKNPGIYPKEMPIPKEKQYPIANNKNFMLLTFGDVIKEFKHYIEIRTDDDQRTFDLRLSDLMRRVGLYTDFNKPELEELFKSVNVYTDTNLFFQGLEQIFKWCLDHRAKSNRINISIESESKFYLLKIKHIGSNIGYEKDSSKLSGLGGDLNKVRQLFFNICDWEILTILSDGKSYRIELLSSNVNDIEKPSAITNIEPVDGVIHIIKLYKTVNL